MASRAHREEVARRAREALVRGEMSHDERVEFDRSRAYEMHRAELRRHPRITAPELDLASADIRDSEFPSTALWQPSQMRRTA